MHGFGLIDRVLLAAVPAYLTLAVAFPRLRTNSGTVLNVLSFYISAASFAVGDWFFGVMYGIVALLQWQGADPWRHLVEDRAKREQMLAAVEGAGKYVFYAALSWAFFIFTSVDVFGGMGRYLPKNFVIALPFLFLVPAIVLFIVEQRRINKQTTA